MALVFIRPSGAPRVLTVVLGALYALALIVCLIVDLATGGGLEWFWQVCASLAVAASLTIVPFVLRIQRIPITLGSLWVSLAILLQVCAWYTGGAWFPLTLTAITFGFLLCFLPLFLAAMPFSRGWNHKGVICMAVDTAFLFVLLAVAAHHAGVFDLFLPVMVPVAAFGLILPWALFMVIRYLLLGPLSKAGLCCVLTGAYSWVSTLFFPSFIGYTTSHALASSITALALSAVGLFMLLIAFRQHRVK